MTDLADHAQRLEEAERAAGRRRGARSADAPLARLCMRCGEAVERARLARDPNATECARCGARWG
ncbi:MAG: TraR/DksA family transcriptional regulator [Alphaproteobacteria bacterium]|nr:TraR/DksA family transcriptional regulator [Alphaproteobacteria bacterium]